MATRKKKWVLYLPREVYLLVKLFAVGTKSNGDVIRDAVLDMIEGGEGYVIDYPLTIEDKYRVDIDDETHYLISRLKVELDYKTMGDLVYDAVVNYAIKRGLKEECIRNIFQLEVE